mmetsp:Transcript_53602/g.127468  ORF Transcript_53602/g.127468 Transcript_53602/m.127468 type:complete len:210 (-) Transcript_53602:278-907(-)
MSLGSITTITASTSGMMATVAVEVCTRPWVSVAGTRCTRCTPASYLSLLYTESPFTWMILVESDSSTMLASHPWLLAYRVYTSTRSAAQMFASSPPVPARISSMTFFSSIGSLGNISTLRSSSRAEIWSSRAFISSRAISRISWSSPASWNMSVAPWSSLLAACHSVNAVTRGSMDARFLVTRRSSAVLAASSGSLSELVMSSNWSLVL